MSKCLSKYYGKMTQSLEKLLCEIERMLWQSFFVKFCRKFGSYGISYSISYSISYNSCRISYLHVVTDFLQLFVRKTDFLVEFFDSSCKFGAFIALRRSFFYRTILQNVKKLTASGGFAPGPRNSIFILVVR